MNKNNIFLFFFCFFCIDKYVIAQRLEGPMATVATIIGYHWDGHSESFEPIYKSKGGIIFGLETAYTIVRLQSSGMRNPAIMIDAQYYYFQKSGTSIGGANVTTQLSKSFLNFGGRYCIDHNSIGVHFFGAGLSIANVSESFTTEGGATSVSTTGVFIEYGIEMGEGMWSFHFSTKYNYIPYDSKTGLSANNSINLGGFYLLGGIGVKIF